jgi:hypothetical protein
MRLVVLMISVCHLQTALNLWRAEWPVNGASASTTNGGYVSGFRTERLMKLKSPITIEEVIL